MEYFVKLYTFVGVTETLNDQMRSILSQLEYAHTVSTYEQKGVPFRTYMYVPETHPTTNDTFYEREDEAHLLKVNVVTIVYKSHSVCSSFIENC